MKHLVWALTFLLVLSPASAYLISDYPLMFFDNDDFTAIIVKGSQRDSAEITAANLIINDLPRSGRHRRDDMPVYYYRYRVRPVPVTTILSDTQVPKGDEIVIGTPCTNSRVRELLKIPQRLCKTILDSGLIQLIEDEEGSHLLVTGPTGRYVLHAAEILTNPRYRLRLRTKKAPIRRISYRTSYGGTLDIGETIGVEIPAIYYGYPYSMIDYRVSTYGTLLGRNGRFISVPYQEGRSLRSMYRYPYYPQNRYEYAGSKYGAIIVKKK